MGNIFPAPPKLPKPLSLALALLYSNWLIPIFSLLSSPLDYVLAGPKTPLIDIYVLLLFIACQSAWDICSLFTQSQWLGVTKQIFRPTEFFPLTITETITLTNPLKSPYGWIFISYWLQADSPDLLCSVQCCNITNKLWLSLYSFAISIPGPAGSDWVGGDRLDQTR